MVPHSSQNYCFEKMRFKIPARRTPPCANNFSTIHFFSMLPAYSGVSSSGYSCRGALPSVSGSSDSAGHTISQLSLWMGALHAYGQTISESLVSGGPCPGPGLGFRGAASTPCGDAHSASTADSESRGAGHEFHESTSEPQRPAFLRPEPNPSQTIRRV